MKRKHQQEDDDDDSFVEPKKQKTLDCELNFDALKHDRAIVLHIFSFLNGAVLLRKLVKPYEFDEDKCFSALIQFLFYKVSQGNSSTFQYASRFPCVLLSKSIDEYLCQDFASSPLIPSLIPVYKNNKFESTNPFPTSIAQVSHVSQMLQQFCMKSFSQDFIQALKDFSYNVTITCHLKTDDNFLVKNVDWLLSKPNIKLIVSMSSQLTNTIDACKKFAPDQLSIRKWRYLDALEHELLDYCKNIIVSSNASFDCENINDCHKITILDDSQDRECEFEKTVCGTVISPLNLCSYSATSFKIVNSNNVHTILMQLHFSNTVKKVIFSSCTFRENVFSLDQLVEVCSKFERLVFENCSFSTLHNWLQVAENIEVLLYNCEIEEATGQEVSAVTNYCMKNGFNWTLKITKISF